MGGGIEYYCLSEILDGSGGFYYGVKNAMKYDTDYISLSDDDYFYRKNYFEEIFKASKKYTNVNAFQGFSYDNVLDKYFVQGSKVINWNTLNTMEINNDNKDVLADISTFVGLTISTKIVKKLDCLLRIFYLE